MICRNAMLESPNKNVGCLMKIIITFLTSLLLTFPIINYALPLLGSPYAGAEGGIAFVSESEKFSIKDDPLLAGRVFVGYQQFAMLGFEVGYDYIQNPSPKNNNAQIIKDLKLQGYDASIKLMTPSILGLKLYASLGGIYLQQHPTSDQHSQQKLVDHYSLTTIFPTAGIGLMYLFNPHFAARISWTRSFGHDQIRNTNFIPIGIVVIL